MISSSAGRRMLFYTGHPKAKDAFKVCPTPDPCLVVEGQRHTRFPGVPRTKSSILLTIRIHQIWWRVTGLPTTLDAFNAIPRPWSSALLNLRSRCECVVRGAWCAMSLARHFSDNNKTKKPVNVIENIFASYIIPTPDISQSTYYTSF